MQVVFRVDGGPTIGTGHVVRCLTLAAEVRRRGADVTFVSRPMPPTLARRIAQAGYDHHLIATNAADLPAGPWPAPVQEDDAERTRACAHFQGAGVAIVDHYGLGAPWEAVIGDSVERVVVIDDLADRAHDCDLLLDQNWSGPATGQRYEGLVPARCRLLLGPRYAMLQRRYAELRDQIATLRRSVDRLLVSFGGSDPTGETRKVLRALDGRAMDRLDVDVVLGGTSAGQGVREEITRRPNARLHIDVPSLADLLAEAHLALGAGGTTTWERICLGVPSIVVTAASNQVPVTKALHEAGAVDWVGDAGQTSPDTYRRRITAAIAGEFRRPPPLVDGWGAIRVALALLPPSVSHLSLQLARMHDAPSFVGADRGAAGGGPSYLDGPSVWTSQIERLRAGLGRSGQEPLLIVLDEVPVGGVWTHPSEGRVMATYWLDDSLDDTRFHTEVQHQLAAYERSDESEPPTAGPN